MYKLMIIDYCMEPGWNGPETTQKIRSLLMEAQKGNLVNNIDDP